MDGFFACFSELEDPRDDNARHDLLQLLVIALCAVLCGAEDCSDMALFGRAKEAFFHEFLCLRHGIPSHHIFSRVFRLIDRIKFHACFLVFMRRFAKTIQGAIAIDGKTLRRSFDRAFKTIGEEEGRAWLQRHLDYCTAPLLAEPWVLDADSTIKPLYGHQEGAVLGYNPKKPGRPSHVYHTYTIAGLRLVLYTEVAAGNQHASNHAAPGLWALLDRIPRDCWPALLRGECGFGEEAIMREAEGRGLPYPFRLRLPYCGIICIRQRSVNFLVFIFSPAG